MKKRSSLSFPAVGSSSLLIIFLVLVLISFATLSLLSAKNSFNQSKKLADHRAAYYDACNTAELMLAKCDEIFFEQGRNLPASDVSDFSFSGDFENSLADDFENALSDVFENSLTSDFESSLASYAAELNKNSENEITDLEISENYVVFSVKINEKQSLAVKFSLDSSKNCFQTAEKRTVSSTEWNPNNTLNVLK